MSEPPQQAPFNWESSDSTVSPFQMTTVLTLRKSPETLQRKFIFTTSMYYLFVLMTTNSLLPQVRVGT